MRKTRKVTAALLGSIEGRHARGERPRSPRKRPQGACQGAAPAPFLGRRNVKNRGASAVAVRRSSTGGDMSESCAYTPLQPALQAMGSDLLLRLVPATPDNAKDERALLEYGCKQAASFASPSRAVRARKMPHSTKPVPTEAYPVAYI